MANHGWLCQVCEQEDATLFCMCSESPVFLCSVCLAPHISKNLSIIHTNLPILAYGHHTAPGYNDRLSARQKRSEVVRSKAETAVTCIEECQERVASGIATLIETAKLYRDEAILHLQQWKEYVMNAMQEVENYVYEDAPNFSTGLAMEMREEWPSANASFQYFTYNVNILPAVAALYSILTESFNRVPMRETTQPDTETATVKMCILKGKAVKVVDLTTGKKDAFEVSQKFTDGTVFAFIRNSVLAAVGGSPATTEAFLIDISTCELKKVSPTATARNLAGVIGIDGVLYVFGGKREKTVISSCEKYTSETQTWSNLDDMAYPRAVFSPCEYQRRVYLVDMSQTETRMEVFSLDTDKFSVYPVDLPSVRQFSVAVVAEGELVVFGTALKVSRLRLGSETSFRVKEFSNIGNRTPSMIPPIVLNRKVFYVNLVNADLLEFDLDRDCLTVSAL